MKNPISISQIIGETAKKMGLKKRIEENMAVIIWPEVVGKKISEKSRALKITRGTLYVKTESPAWNQQLTFLSEELKTKLNERLGKKIVKEIRFRG